MRSGFFKYSVLLLISSLIFIGCSGAPKTYKEKTLDDMYPILTRAQFEEMKSLKTDDEIKQFIETYWDKLESDAGISGNGLQNEYKSRLEYANKHFPDRRGWGRSDRKEIYMIYGPPSFIDRKDFTNIGMEKFSNMKAVEIWLYMNPAKNNSFPSPYDDLYYGEQKFIFADLTGSGVYKLLYSNEIEELTDVRLLYK